METCTCTISFKYIILFFLSQYKRTPRECLGLQDGTVPDECFALRNTFFECKHSIVSINKFAY